MKKILTFITTLLLVVCTCFSFTACGSNGKVVADGSKIVVGVTDYAPMDYIDSTTNKWTGFDAELAEKVFTELGYTVEFKEIDWDTKIIALNSGTIDCIWNGMTVTDELLNNLLLSSPYLKNTQVAVVRVEDASQYQTKEDLVGKVVAVESGSAAETLVSSIPGVASPRKLSNQNAAILDVFGLGSNVAIVDNILARNICQSETYNGVLTYVDLGLSDVEFEEFAIAFRKSDSKLLYNVNKKLANFKMDGTILTLAYKYGIADSLI